MECFPEPELNEVSMSCSVLTGPKTDRNSRTLSINCIIMLLLRSIGKT